MAHGKQDVRPEPLTAVILAGGRGTRLRPYTVSLPKPLVPVGDRPILEILIGQLVRDGFTRLILAVGHLAGLIEAYFGNGARFGVAIEYAREIQPLGTAAPLAVLADQLPSTFLVVNGDVLSDINFGGFLRGHREDSRMPLLTIATHQRSLRSEYGVLETDADGRVIDYIEKPVYPLSVSEGIYAFSRAALDWIPEGARFDFPDLVVALLSVGQPVYASPHDGLWLDIGRPEDYEQAQEIVTRHPERFVMARSEHVLSPVQSLASTTSNRDDAWQ